MEQGNNLTSFRAFISSVVEIGDVQWKEISSLVQVKSYKKKELFHKEGSLCQVVGFILQGCFRSVKYAEFEERTFDFAVENEFITDYYGILKNTASAFDIIAIENSVVACMNAKELFRLLDSEMVWQRFGRLMAEQASCYYQERLLSAFFDPPRLRYEKLLTASPDIILRVPQHIIANYLGVTKETLSRIRKKISQ